MSAVRFQSLPPLSSDEYAALEKSILDHGVLVPIVVDEDGVVIDGHHRQKITTDHDLPCPREVKTGFADTEKRTLALSMNLDRRHLTREQRRSLVAESIKADPQLSDRQHGRRTGVDHKTAGRVRDDLEGRGEIPHVDERSDSLGRQQPVPTPEPGDKPRRKPLIDDARALGATDAAINPRNLDHVLAEIANTLTAVAAACCMVEPEQITQSAAAVQHLAVIRDCLDAIHDYVEQWEAH